MSRRVLVVEADGGSRGNPGPSGAGALVRDGHDGPVVAEVAVDCGRTTNNVAEYRGLIAGLEAAQEVDADAEVHVRMDSKLVVEQVSGRWKVKQPHLQPLALEAVRLLSSFADWHARWIPRAENSAADALANEAMDGRPRRDVPLGALVLPVEDEADDQTTPEAEQPDAEAAPADRGGWATQGAPGVRLLLARHGRTALTPQRRFSGRGDVPLSAEGREEARRLAVRLAGEGVDAVVTSPLARARQTAEAVATACRVDLQVDDDLVECDFGAWEGLTFAEARDADPEAFDAWLASTSVAPPAGESFDAVAERVAQAQERLVARAPGTVVVVAHVTPVKQLLRVALDAGPAALRRLHLDAASLSEVSLFVDGHASVRRVNAVDHLDLGAG